MKRFIAGTAAAFSVAIGASAAGGIKAFPIEPTDSVRSPFANDWQIALATRPARRSVVRALRQGVEIYSDRDRNVTVRFAETRFGTVIVSSDLPARWIFTVDIDGDQDGAWGTGHGRPEPSVKTSPDRAFGQDANNGVFCSQYILTPDTLSECGGLKSNGRAILTGYDGKMRATVSLEIPADEFFGSLQSAHVQTCVWDTVRRNCQHQLPNLLEIKRAGTARRR